MLAGGGQATKQASGQDNGLLRSSGGGGTYAVGKLPASCLSSGSMALELLRAEVHLCIAQSPKLASL
jgi:hypothetical protein